MLARAVAWPPPEELHACPHCRIVIFIHTLIQQKQHAITHSVVGGNHDLEF